MAARALLPLPPPAAMTGDASSTEEALGPRSAIGRQGGRCGAGRAGPGSPPPPLSTAHACTAFCTEWATRCVLATVRIRSLSCRWAAACSCRSAAVPRWQGISGSRSSSDRARLSSAHAAQSGGGRLPPSLAVFLPPPLLLPLAEERAGALAPRRPERGCDHPAASAGVTYTLPSIPSCDVSLELLPPASALHPSLRHASGRLPPLPPATPVEVLVLVLDSELLPPLLCSRRWAARRARSPRLSTSRWPLWAEVCVDCDAEARRASPPPEDGSCDAVEVCSVLCSHRPAAAAAEEAEEDSAPHSPLDAHCATLVEELCSCDSSPASEELGVGRAPAALWLELPLVDRVSAVAPSCCELRSSSPRVIVAVLSPKPTRRWPVDAREEAGPTLSELLRCAAHSQASCRCSPAPSAEPPASPHDASLATAPLLSVPTVDPGREERERSAPGAKRVRSCTSSGGGDGPAAASTVFAAGRCQGAGALAPADAIGPAKAVGPSVGGAAPCGTALNLTCGRSSRKGRPSPTPCHAPSLAPR